MQSRDHRGFTVVELLVAMVVLSVVGGIVTTSLTSSMDTTRQVETRIEAMTDLRTATERVSRELRAACPLLSMAVDDASMQVPRDGERYHYHYRIDDATDALTVTVKLRDPDDTGDTDTDGDGVLWLDHRPEQVLIGDLETAVDPFTFLGADEAVLDPATVPPRDVATVALTLQRTLGEQDPLTVTTRIHVRNQGASCG